MGATNAGHRVAYDRMWGALLLLSCLIPAQLTSEGVLVRRFYVPGDVPLSAWVLVGTGTGLVAMVLGFAGSRGRWRHGTNILLGCLVLSMPLVWPAIWDNFPLANPAQLPLASLGRVGWVMLLALGAVLIVFKEFLQRIGTIRAKKNPEPQTDGDNAFICTFNEPIN